jgi:nucleoside-diphosphate-sugar epimerase
VYDVVDDEPMPREEVVRVLADAMGKARLRSVPPWLFRLMAPAVADLLTRSQRVSNRRFKEATGWQPSVPNARIGFPLLVSGAWQSRSEPGALPSIRV